MNGRCRICNSKKLKPFLDLGKQPWCNDFVTEDKVGKEAEHPLDLYFCEQCTAIQVFHTVPKEIMYNEHLYLSGVTKSMRKHFQSVSDKVCGELIACKGLVVDIGSNDGTLLSTYKNNGMKVFGVDPCKRAASIANSNGIDTRVDFFNADCAKSILDEHGFAKVISAANVFYHVEELHDIVKGIKMLLDKDGVFVMQGSYLPRIMEKKAFDIMYHEHLLYYRIDTLQYLLDMYDLEIFDVDEAAVHGGSIIAFISHKGTRKVSEKIEQMHSREIEEGYHKFDKYEQFAESIRCLKDEIKTLVDHIKSSGATIYAFGAPAKGTVLLNYCNLTRNEIDCAVEKNELKCGRYIPCTGIPIVHEDLVDEPDYYLLLSWNFINEFCESEAYKSGKRKFIVPIPIPKVVSHENNSSNR